MTYTPSDITNGDHETQIRAGRSVRSSPGARLDREPLLDREPSTLEDAEQSLCAVISPPANVQRGVGCGLVAVGDYSKYERVFEQPSKSGYSATPAPRLVRATQFSDASSSDGCSTSSWRAGSTSPNAATKWRSVPALRLS
jgi:hypothetical protein